MCSEGDPRIGVLGVQRHCTQHASEHRRLMCIGDAARTEREAPMRLCPRACDKLEFTRDHSRKHFGGQCFSLGLNAFLSRSGGSWCDRSHWPASLLFFLFLSSPIFHFSHDL